VLKKVFGTFEIRENLIENHYFFFFDTTADLRIVSRLFFRKEQGSLRI